MPNTIPQLLEPRPIGSHQLLCPRSPSGARARPTAALRPPPCSSLPEQQTDRGSSSPVQGDSCPRPARMAATAAELPIEGKSIKALTLLSLKRTFEMFGGNHGEPLPMDEERQVCPAPRRAGRPPGAPRAAAATYWRR